MLGQCWQGTWERCPRPRSPLLPSARCHSTVTAHYLTAAAQFLQVHPPAHALPPLPAHCCQGQANLAGKAPCACPACTATLLSSPEPCSNPSDLFAAPSRGEGSGFCPASRGTSLSRARQAGGCCHVSRGRKACVISALGRERLRQRAGGASRAAAGNRPCWEAHVTARRGGEKGQGETVTHWKPVLQGTRCPTKRVAGLPKRDRRAAEPPTQAGCRDPPPYAPYGAALPGWQLLIRLPPCSRAQMKHTAAAGGYWCQGCRGSQIPACRKKRANGGCRKHPNLVAPAPSGMVSLVLPLTCVHLHSPAASRRVLMPGSQQKLALPSSDDSHSSDFVCCHPSRASGARLDGRCSRSPLKTVLGSKRKGGKGLQAAWLSAAALGQQLAQLCPEPASQRNRL